MEQEVILDSPTPTGKIYKESAVILGAIIGGPLVAGYIISENFKFFGDYKKAKKVWIYSIVVLLIFLARRYFISNIDKVPSITFILPGILIPYYITKRFQRQKIDTHIKSGGMFFKWWRTFILSLIGCVIVLAVIIVVRFFLGISLEI